MVINAVQYRKREVGVIAVVVLYGQDILCYMLCCYCRLRKSQERSVACFGEGGEEKSPVPTAAGLSGVLGPRKTG
jgi:hypothetical protein